jgi:acyl-CoA dehydrogenase
MINHKLESATFKLLYEAIAEIAKGKAKDFATEVDQHARFPAETLAALKEARALSAGIVSDLGGLAVNVREQAALCKLLAQSCSSSAMILGMHYIKCNSINEWAIEQDFFRNYLQEIVSTQRLIASMTSEEGIGGDLRQSNAAVRLENNLFSISKKSPCLSYVSEADDILLTCRADEQSSHADQRLVLLKADQKKVIITRRWDAMGMRGTCSHACEVSGKASVEQIIDMPFATIATQSMIPDAHFIWSSIWLGIALDAFAKAKKVARKHFISNTDKIPGSARILSDMHNNILALDSQIDSLSAFYVACKEKKDHKALRHIDFALAVNALKLNASNTAKTICLQALEVCGLAGYKNDDELSVARNIRDVLSASVMVSNERLIEVNAARILV